MQAIKSELYELLRRGDIMRAALLTGKVEDAGFQPEPYVEKIMELAARIWHRSVHCHHDPVMKAGHINEILYQSFGMEGKSDKWKQVIDDPYRYYLHTVLNRKVGSPLTLTLIYSILADQVGLAHECIALPSYFLIKITDVASEFYIDPFDSGKFLTREEFQKKFRSALQRNRMLSTNLFEKIEPTQLVGRLVQQLKHVYILKGSALEALRAVEILTVMFPASPELTRDRGILYCEMEYFSKAMEDLRSYLKERPHADDVGEIKKLTAMLRGYREIMN